MAEVLGVRKAAPASGPESFPRQWPCPGVRPLAHGDYLDLVEPRRKCWPNCATLRAHARRRGGRGYEDTFNRAVVRRLARFALEIEDM
jgi:hypothetical protein